MLIYFIFVLFFETAVSEMAVSNAKVTQLPEYQFVCLLILVFYLFKYCLFFRNGSFESKNDGIVRIEIIFLSRKYAYCILSSI